MRYLDSRLIEGLLDEMALDSLLRVGEGLGVGRDTDTTGPLVFAICSEATAGGRESSAAGPSQLLRKKILPFACPHNTSRPADQCPGDPASGQYQRDRYLLGGLPRCAARQEVDMEGPYRVPCMCQRLTHRPGGIPVADMTTLKYWSEKCEPKDN
jgi:hypothetical protein